MGEVSEEDIMPFVQRPQQHPGALMWIIIGLLSVVGVFMAILALTPKTWN